MENVTKPTEYTIKTRDEFEMKMMLQARGMSVAINRYYDDVLRHYIKYDDSLSDSEYALTEKIRDEIKAHFEEYLYD